MIGMNKVYLVGKISKAPEQRGFDDNKFATFQLCTSKKRIGKNGEKEIKEINHNITVFPAELVSYVMGNAKVGKKAFVSGELSYGSYKNKDGNLVFVTNINVTFNEGEVLVIADREAAPSCNIVGVDDIPF